MIKKEWLFMENKADILTQEIKNLQKSLDLATNERNKQILIEYQNGNTLKKCAQRWNLSQTTIFYIVLNEQKDRQTALKRRLATY